MVSELLLCLFLSSLVSFWCYSRLIIAFAVTTATAAIHHWTSDASQYSSLVPNLQPPSLRSLTPQRPLPKIVASMNLTPIALLQVPLWSSSTDLLNHGNSTIIGAFTCPHTPQKDSAPWSHAHMPHGPKLDPYWHHPYHHQCHINPS